MTPTIDEDASAVDLLVLIVVSDDQANQLGKKLVADGFRFTVITASNGLLPTGTSCLMLGIHSSRNAQLMDLVETVCKTRRTYIPAQGQIGPAIGMPPMMIEAEVGSASVYVIPVDTYEVF